VLCEKPITTNPSDLATLTDLAQKQELLLMEGMWTYFLPAILKAKQWLLEGRIGLLQRLESSFGFEMPFDAENRIYNPKLAGGVLLDMGIYPLAMDLFFTENYTFKDLKVSVKKASTGVDSEVKIKSQYGNIHSFLHSSVLEELPNYTRLIGEKGHINIPLFWGARECSLYQNDEQKDHFQDQRKSNGFNYEIESFNRDFLSGKTESQTMPLTLSMNLQRHMNSVMEHF